MQCLESIQSVADHYDVIVFDQFGVLHDGTAPYPHALAAVAGLEGAACSLAVLSNSGKSADLNHRRITDMGFAPDAFDAVMTSGEALRIDMAQGALRAINSIYAIEAAKGDAQTWAGDLTVDFTSDPAAADAILLMGLADGENHIAERAVLKAARKADKLLICSNPDRAAPRAYGRLVESPGALAHEYADAGGRVLFYGKPHLPIFEALHAQLHHPEPHRILMVGDSPEHDIAGTRTAGWDSLFISGGLHSDSDPTTLFAPNALPTYTQQTLR